MMFTTTHRPQAGTTNISQVLACEARLNRLHRLFKTQYNVTEPSIVIEPYLFLGNCISAHDVHHLTKIGVHYVLNVAKRDVEVCPYYSSKIRTLTIDLRDDDRENILRSFDQTFAFIDEARKMKSRVLVHCSHGQSRSPAIVIAYLMRTYDVSLEQCIAHVVKARPCIIPNDGFLKQLIFYDRFLVDRRRRLKEAATLQTIKNTPTTEIPIQRDIPAVTQPSPPAVGTPPQCPAIVPTKTANLLSVDSVSMDLSLKPSAPTSASIKSMQIIPIQVSPDESSANKTEMISNKKTATDDDVLASNKTSNNVDDFQEKPPATEVSKISNKTRPENSSPRDISPAKKRSSPKEMNNPKQISPPVPRSNTGNLHRSHANHHHNHPAVVLTTQQWDFINNYSAHHYGSSEYVQKNFIIEVYDRETNRFIPTTCC